MTLRTRARTGSFLHADRLQASRQKLAQGRPRRNQPKATELRFGRLPPPPDRLLPSFPRGKCVKATLRPYGSTMFLQAKGTDGQQRPFVPRRVHYSYPLDNHSVVIEFTLDSALSSPLKVLTRFDKCSLCLPIPSTDGQIDGRTGERRRLPGNSAPSAQQLVINAPCGEFVVSSGHEAGGPPPDSRVR